MHITSPLLWVAALVTPGLSQITLGTAAPYGALAETGITNAGLTVITGNIGTTGASINGFPPGIATGTTKAATPDVFQARADAHTAYTTANGLTGGIDSTDSSELGGRILTAGIYKYTSGVSLHGVLTLDGAGRSDGTWVFQIGSTLVTGALASVNLINGASACNIFWAVGSSATIGLKSAFAGNILAFASINLALGASNNGGLHAGAAVTLSSNRIAAPTCISLGSRATASLSLTQAAETTSVAKPTSTPSSKTTLVTSIVKPTSVSASTSQKHTSASKSKVAEPTSYGYGYGY
ncbi:outer membrane autotransporter barrel [Sclerotinia borealis F-4128]|uniref:Outer membrane autotransporter barrel n=1 Tax=Sclerotinia borealis (strain F-4128) TaxID=1432307 RepID=W9CT01_SCLBF|nr:outer membrane autotransporter barrel [Sclerotinia borealis F-4128]